MQYVRGRRTKSSVVTITTTLVALALTLFSFSNVFAAAANKVPRTIALQGYLTDTGGSPIVGTARLRFCMFTNASRIWCGEYTTVAMNNGLFSVEMGSVAQGGAVLAPADPVCASFTPFPVCNATLPIDAQLLA